MSGTETLEVGSSRLSIDSDKVDTVPDKGPIPCESTHPMEQDAFEYWRNGPGFQRHLPFDMVWEFAKAVGRPLTLVEIQALVGLDGEEVEGELTGRTFQPVFWIQPFGKLLESIRQHRDILEALKELDEHGKVIRFGHFFVLRGGLEGTPVAIDGDPYFVGRDGFSLNNSSHFVEASKRNAKKRGFLGVRWGLSRIEMDNRREARKAEATKLEADREQQEAARLREEEMAQAKLNKLFFGDKHDR